jgi:hypothetical protein
MLHIAGYRIGFFSADGDEPPHAHVTKGWLHGKVLAGSSSVRQ